MHHTTRLLSVAIAITLSACTSIETTYKGFYDGPRYRKMNVAADGTALQDGKGKRDILLANKSVRAAQMVQDRVVSVLRSKGYSPSPMYTSTGLSVPNEIELYVSNDPAATEGPSVTGAYTMKRRGSTATKAQRYAAERMFDRLLALSLVTKAASETRFPEVADLGVPKGQYLVAVSGLARNVNTSKQVGQAVLLAAASLGTVVAWEPDVAIIKVAIIDPSTQRIVWANEAAGKVDTPEEALRNINMLLEKLPTQQQAAGSES